MLEIGLHNRSHLHLSGSLEKLLKVRERFRYWSSGELEAHF